MLFSNSNILGAETCKDKLSNGEGLEDFEVISENISDVRPNSNRLGARDSCVDNKPKTQTYKNHDDNQLSQNLQISSVNHKLIPDKYFTERNEENLSEISFFSHSFQSDSETVPLSQPEVEINEKALEVSLMQDNSIFTSRKNSKFSVLSFFKNPKPKNKEEIEYTTRKQTNPWLNWKDLEDLEYYDSDDEHDETEAMSTNTEYETSMEHYQQIETNPWDEVTDEIISTSPKIHNRLNLLDKLPLLTITGKKIGLVCEIEMVKDYIIFKIFETFSTQGITRGRSVGQASGPIYMFIEFFEVMRVTDSLCYHNFSNLKCSVSSTIEQGYEMLTRGWCNISLQNKEISNQIIESSLFKLNVLVYGECESDESRKTLGESDTWIESALIENHIPRTLNSENVSNTEFISIKESSKEPIYDTVRSHNEVEPNETGTSISLHMGTEIEGSCGGLSQTNQLFVMSIFNSFSQTHTAVCDESEVVSNALEERNTNNEPEKTKFSIIDIDVPLLNMEQRHSNSSLNVIQEHVVATMVDQENAEAEEKIIEQEPTSTQRSEGEEHTEHEIQNTIEEQNTRNPEVDRSDSSSEEEEPNIEPVTVANIKEMLWSALTAESLSKVKYILDLIIFSQTNFNFDPFTETINEEDTIETLLLNISPKAWPPRKSFTCGLDDGCPERFNSEGELRMHFKKCHKIDIQRVKDEIQIRIEKMINQQIKVRVFSDQAEITNERLSKPNIRCHFPDCNYQRDRDDGIRKHRKQHILWKKEIKFIGVFWAKLWKFVRLYRRYPTIMEMLSEGESIMCNYENCSTLYLNEKSADIHMDKSHHIKNDQRKKAHEIKVFTTFSITQNLILRDNVGGLVHDRHNEDDPTAEQRWARRMHQEQNQIAGVDIQIPENENIIIDQMEQIGEIERTPTEINSNMGDVVTDEPEAIDEGYSPDMIERFQFIDTYVHSDDRVVDVTDITNTSTLQEIEEKWIELLTVAKNTQDEFVTVIKLREAAQVCFEDEILSTESSIIKLLYSLKGEFWPTGGRGNECPMCKIMFLTKTGFINHIHSHENLSKQPKKCWIELAMNMKLKLRPISYVGIEEKKVKILRCKIPGCPFVTKDKNRMSIHYNHNDEVHDKYFEREAILGDFYSSLITFIQKEKSIPSIGEMLGENKCKMRVCNKCGEFLSLKYHSINNHFERFHSNTNIADEDKTSIMVLKYVSDDTSEDIINKFRRDALPELVNIDEIDTATDRIYNQIMEEEVNAEILNINPNIIIQRADAAQHVENTFEDETVTLPSESDETEDQNLNIVISPTRLRRLQKAWGWFEKYENIQTNIKLSRIQRRDRYKVFRGLDELFENQLIPLLREFKPDKNEDLDDEQKWKAFEGTLLQCEHLMRMHVCTKLGRNPKTLYDQRVSRKTTTNQSQLSSNKNISVDKLVKYLREYALFHTEEVTADTRNQIRSLECKIKRYIEIIPSNIRSEAFGTKCIEEIMEEVSQFESSGQEWLYMKISSIKSASDNQRKTSVNEQRLRDYYQDDAQKTLRNFIWTNDSPKCKIPLSELTKFHKDNFMQEGIEFEPDEDNLFNMISKILDENESESDLFDPEIIKTVVQSRKHSSAPGPDAIQYSVYMSPGKHAIEYLSLQFKTVVKMRRVPESWKKSSMILLYKKDELSCPKNWRPITITNSIYRIFTCVLSRFVNKMNNNYEIFSKQQKGFLPGMTGITEHVLILQEIFADAQRRKHSVITCTLDFKNAFGSVPHGLIQSNLRQLGFPKFFNELVESIYSGANTNIITDEGKSPPIDILKGTKQGCPLSPLLFNICIEPLIQALMKNNISDMYEFGEEVCGVQAYADDIILIAKNEGALQNMLSTCEKFCKFSRMKLEPKKTVIYGYKFNNLRQRTQLDKEITLDGETLPINKTKFFRYLGADISGRKNDKIINSSSTKMTFLKKLNDICDSKLLLVQKIHAIRVFLIPTLDFILMNSQMRQHDVENLNKNIRGKLNKLLNGTILTNVYHASWKDGGLSIPSIENKRDVLILRGMSQLLLSNDDAVKKCGRYMMRQEKKYREISNNNSDGESQFLGWSDQKPKNSTNSIFGRAKSAAMRLKMKIDIIFKDDNPLKEIDSLVFKDDETKEEKVCSSTKLISAFLTSMIKLRYQKTLRDTHSFHLHSFESLSMNKLSNDFIRNVEFPISDPLFKFIINARNNSLPTKEFVAIMNRVPPPMCPICQNLTQSLKHEINKCRTNLKKITERHNLIAAQITYEISNRLNERVEIFENCEMKYVNLPDELKSLKPDVQIWNLKHDKLILLEISIPYACRSNGRNYMDTVYEKKADKYTDLVAEIRNQNIYVQYHIIIISSLGAVDKRTIKSIRKLIQIRSNADVVIRKLSRAAIKYSAAIFWKYPLNPSGEWFKADEYVVNDDQEEEESESEDDDSVISDEVEEIEINTVRNVTNEVREDDNENRETFEVNTDDDGESEVNAADDADRVSELSQVDERIRRLFQPQPWR